MTALEAWLDRIEALHPSDIELGLERVHQVARRMSLPLCPGKLGTVVVGGTNGKGSTVASLELLAMADGLKVFAYTSPHVQNFRERARLDGRWLPDARWVEAFEAVERGRQQTELTFFEFTTLAAIWIAAQERPDIGVFEIGLGGRLDAVNILEPSLSVLTSVALDHEAWLGDTVEAIAREKAAIGRSRRPLLLGDPAVAKVVREQMSKVEAIVNVLGEDFPEQKPPRGLEAIHPVSWSLALETRRVLWQAREGVPEKLEPSALVRLLPGRFQAVDLMISGRKGKVILDVAHNPQAFERLFDLLVRRGKRYHVVCGMMRDKAPPEALGRFANCVRGWHVASLPGPRGAEASLLAGRLDVPASRYDSVSEALDSAWNALEPDEELVVCGSFVTVELALQWIDKRKDYDSTSE